MTAAAETEAPGLGRRSASILFATLVASSLSFAFVVVVAHVAGVAARGHLAFLVAVPTLSSFAATLGLETANLHFAARRPETRPALAATSVLRGAVWGTVVAAVAALLLVAFPSLIPSGVPVVALALALAATPLMCVQFLLVSLLTASDRLRRANAIRVAIPGISLLAFILLAAAERRGTAAAALAWFAGQAAGAGAALSTTAATIGIAVPRRDRQVEGLTGYGLRAHVGNLADLATFRVDTLVVAAFWGAAELGIYAAAVNVAEVMLYLPTAVATVLLPYRSRRDATEDETRRATLVVAALAAIGAAAGAAAAPWLVDLLYPDEFEGATTPLRVLFLAMVAMSVRRVLSAELAAVRRQGIASAVAVATFLVVLALDLVLIPRHGATGAAWASAAGYAFGGLAIVVAVAACSNGRADVVPPGAPPENAPPSL